MNAQGYSIFNHAQMGHRDCTQRHDSQDDVGPTCQVVNATADECHVQTHQRIRPMRGWAVELGLGLGSRFNKRKNK